MERNTFIKIAANLYFEATEDIDDAQYCAEELLEAIVNEAGLSEEDYLSSPELNVEVVKELAMEDIGELE